MLIDSLAAMAAKVAGLEDQVEGDMITLADEVSTINVHAMMSGKSLG